MTAEMFNLMSIPVLTVIGFWLEGIGGKHGFVDKFFSPIPLTFIGCVFIMIRSCP